MLPSLSDLLAPLALVLVVLVVLACLVRPARVRVRFGRLRVSIDSRPRRVSGGTG